MVYLRSIPEDELFSAQLELLMQHGRIATMTANLVGAAVGMAALWTFFEPTWLLLWGFGLLTLLLLHSLHMSSALAERRFVTNPGNVFWKLVLGAALTGCVWSVTFIYVSRELPASLQYLLLTVIVIIASISLAVMVVIREYFLVFVFSALFPIAWWSLAHVWDGTRNLVIGLLLLGVTALLVAASNGIHETFRRMLSLSWQQEAMARELGQITNSLRDRNRQLQEARRQLTDLANVDELTGLGNRRLVNQALREEVSRAQRSQSWLSVILIDVDFFKNYNDTYGHPAGDDVLRQIADVLRKASARAGEVVARFGGEEFIMILPGARIQDAVHAAERFERLIREENIPHIASEVSDRITVSQGVVALKPDAEMNAGTVIDRADAALYRAKNEGRNRICVS